MLLGQQENRQNRKDEFIKRHLTTSLCPLIQVFINGVNPHMSLPFKSMFLILEKVLVYINQLTWHFRAEVLCWSLL